MCEVTEVNTVHEMRSEDYAVEDDALPLLNLHPVTEVGIDIEKASVKLFIHPKQYKWPRDCSEACTVKTEFSVPRSGPRQDDL
jgi:hypothetical protein